MDVKRINDTISVSGQIQPQDMARLKAQGFTTVINNRPDGEAPDQPDSAQIEEAAHAAGLRYHHIPLGRDGVTPDMVDATRAAMEASGGPVFAFCRSGTRSTTLWALSQAGTRPSREIIAEAADAGYDLNHLSGQLDRT